MIAIGVSIYHISFVYRVVSTQISNIVLRNELGLYTARNKKKTHKNTKTKNTKNEYGVLKSGHILYGC